MDLPQGYLVGGIPTPLKNIFVSWDDDIPNIWNKIHFPNHDMLKMMLKHGEKLYMDLH